MSFIVHVIIRLKFAAIQNLRANSAEQDINRIFGLAGFIFKKKLAEGSSMFRNHICLSVGPYLSRSLCMCQCLSVFVCVCVCVCVYH